MESNLHTFKSPISNTSTIYSTNTDKNFNIFINNTHSTITKSIMDNFSSLIKNTSLFENILETLGKQSDYRWNDTFIWSDDNIWSDIEQI